MADKNPVEVFITDEDSQHETGNNHDKIDMQRLGRKQELLVRPLPSTIPL